MSDFLQSFVFAFRGLGDALISERNFRILWLCGLLIILANFLVNFELFAQIIFLLLIFIILALELVNSALEKSCDSLSSGHSLLIKKAKDFSAAAVLLVVIASVFIFGLLLINRWPALCEELKTNALSFVALGFIGLFNFPSCLKQSLGPFALALSFAALILHLGLLVSSSGSVFFLILSLLFHASLAGTYFVRKIFVNAV